MPVHSLRSAGSKDAPWMLISENQITSESTFSEAAQLWLQSLSGSNRNGPTAFRKISKKTEVSYRQYVDSLNLFFRDTKLGDIRIDHISKYEDLRTAGDEPFVRYRRPQDAKPQIGPNGEKLPAKGKTPCPAKAKQVNQEIHVLRRIMKCAKVWGEELEYLYKPLLVEESDVPRALTKEEQAHWLQVTRNSERWHLVYYYSVLAFATCMGTNEIRSLRLCDIHMEDGYINIPWAGSKNKYRHRTVQIGTEGDDAYEAMRWLLNRSQTLGGKSPHHYLFPFRQRSMPGSAWSGESEYDPSRPITVSGLAKLWDEVQQESKLMHFRRYDTRHTAITRLAEAGIPISVIMDMAGHISQTMTKHYTHISDKTKLQAMRQVQLQARAAAQRNQPRAEEATPVRAIQSVMADAPPPYISPAPAGFTYGGGSTFFLNSFTASR